MAKLPWSQSPWSTGAGGMATAPQPGKVMPAPAPNYSGMSAAGYSAGNTAAKAHSDYVTGQAAGAANASQAAYTAGNRAASQVSPGGPQSVQTQASNARQVAADKAGLDFMQPGINERFMGAHGNDLLTGGASDLFWRGYGTDLMGGSNSQAVFDEAQANRPQLPSADLSPYYDRARQTATQQLSAAQAARGSYGSSVGVGQVGSMLADLGAQQAKDEADYGLKRSDLERNWMTARGDLAGQADRDATSRWTATGSGAATADDQALNRWRTTQQAAESAQGSQRQRGQDLFTNNMAIGNALSGVTGNSFETGAVQDQGIMDAIIKLGLAKDAAGVADLMRRANEDQAVAKQVMDAISAYATSQSGKKEET